MNKQEVEIINRLGGLPDDQTLIILKKKILKKAKAFAKKKDGEGKYFGNFTIAAQCLSFCCKCGELEMPGSLKLVPISYVGALAYHADFNGGSGTKSFVEAYKRLRADIENDLTLQRQLRGYGAIPQFGKTTYYLDERQLYILYLHHLAPSPAEVYRIWRKIRIWNIHAKHVDWFEDENPQYSEYLSLIRNIKWNKKNSK